MKGSTTLSTIASALVTAQSNIGAAVKGAKNPFFHSSYADLGSVMEACKSALNDNGITVLQPIMGDVVETTLLHKSGEFISSETKIVCAKPNDPQAYGSAITYARRYGLQSLVFIPAEDDDGEKAVVRGVKPTPPPVQQPVKKVPAYEDVLSQSQSAVLYRFVDEGYIPHEFMERIPKLTKKKANEWIAQAQKKKDEAENMLADEAAEAAMKELG